MSYIDRRNHDTHRFHEIFKSQLGSDWYVPVHPTVDLQKITSSPSATCLPTRRLILVMGEMRNALPQGDSAEATDELGTMWAPQDG